MSEAVEAKIRLWNDFLSIHQIDQESVPLFEASNRIVKIFEYGQNRRYMLKRSREMEELMRHLGHQLIAEYRSGNVRHDGLLYLMFRREPTGIVPLYFGKAELFGKGAGNLSANIEDLASGHGKFGRWGYNYAYHLGDLSAVTLPGHPDAKRTRKYEAWRKALFVDQLETVQLLGDVRFWACPWGPDRPSIWREQVATRLAFEEYLLIGVAGEIFPQQLLNREGRNRWDGKEFPLD